MGAKKTESIEKNDEDRYPGFLNPIEPLNGESVPNALSGFPKPTLEQFEASLEERVLADRRVTNSLKPDEVDRRISKRRKTD